MAEEKKKLNVDEFIKQLTEKDMLIAGAMKEHPPEKNHNKQKGGVRDHKPGEGHGCTHCLKIRKYVQETSDFEKEHLGVTRMQPATVQNTVTMMRNIILMMKEGGEL